MVCGLLRKEGRIVSSGAVFACERGWEEVKHYGDLCLCIEL